MAPYRYGMLDAGARQVLASTRFSDVRWHDEIDSTNRALADLARAGAPEGVVVVAGHQTAGRGRLNRTWQAPPGSSLLMSVLLRPHLPPEHAGWPAMVVAVAASDAVAEVAGFRPDLKWPNDLVVSAGKLGGILSETLLSGGGQSGGSSLAGVVVGVGINVNWPHPLPAELAELEGLAVSANRVAGREVDVSALLVRLLLRLEEHYGVLLEPGGSRAIVANYRRLCSTLGRQVRVEQTDRSFEGRAVEVTNEGHLVVRTGEDGGGVERVTAADVVHLRPF